MDYIVSAADLLKLAKTIVDDGKDYVEISFFEPDEELPASVHFEAIRKGDFVWVDYEGLEVVNP